MSYIVFPVQGIISLLINNLSLSIFVIKMKIYILFFWYLLYEIASFERIKTALWKYSRNFELRIMWPFNASSSCQVMTYWLFIVLLFSLTYKRRLKVIIRAQTFWQFVKLRSIFAFSKTRYIIIDAFFLTRWLSAFSSLWITINEER